jgi:hypothetical protein
MLRPHTVDEVQKFSLGLGCDGITSYRTVKEEPLARFGSDERVFQYW